MIRIRPLKEQPTKTLRDLRGTVKARPGATIAAERQAARQALADRTTEETK
jgi:hypothetical protein